MSFRLLADENVDHRVVHRLEHYGHDIEHVDFVAELGKGSADEKIAEYCRTTNRLLVTNDDDFLTDFDEEDHQGLLFIGDETLSAEQIADILHTIATTVDQETIQNVFYVSSAWL